MEKEKRNRKIAIFFVVSLGIALAHGLYAYFNQHATESAFLADFNAQRDILEHALQAQVENATKNLLFIANIFASDEEVQRLFLAGKQAVEAEGGGAGKAAAARARKALNDAVAPKWNRALEGFQTRQLHFHLAPGSLSFLRVHQPEQYGDRLDDLRFIVVDSNADRQPRTGFESGRLFSGLRGVMPVWARDPATGQPVHVGAVEAGTSFSNALQAIDRNFGVGAAILLRADHVTSVAWPATLKHKQGDKLDPCGCYLDSASRDDASELIRRAIVQTGPFGSAEAVHFVDLGSTKIALFLAPIRDYLGNRDSRRPNVGLAVFWRDVSQQYATYQREQRLNVVYAALSFLLIQALFFVGFRLSTRHLQLRAAALTNRLHQLSNQSPDGIYVIDAQSAKLVDANTAACRTLDYTKSELLALHLWDISALIENPQTWHALRPDIIEKQGQAFEDQLRHRDGHAISVEVKTTCITEPEGQFFIATARDVTERNSAQARQKASEALLRTTLDSTADGILVIGEDGRVLSANKRFQTLWNVSDELMRLDNHDAFVEHLFAQLAEPDALTRELERIRGTEETIFDTVRFKNRRIFEVYTVPLHLPGALGRVWSFRDVTEKENAVANLRHEKGLLKTLIQTLPDLVWLKDPEGAYLGCNPVFEDFFGATEAQILGKTDYDFIDEELADFFREHDLKAMANGGPSCNEEWITFASDGRKALLETTKTPMRDGQGHIIGVLGIGHDITQRKQAEQAAQESSQRYAAVLSSTKDGFWVVDEQGRLTEVNRAYCGYSGYTQAELVGMPVSELEALQSADEIAVQIRRIAAQGSAIIESSHRRKDGSTWPVEVSISYSPVEGGRFFCFLRDITERKQNEVLAKLREELAELVYNGDKDQLMRKALDTAEQVTQSQIGFFHFVENDQETIALQVWSTRTLKEMCYAEGHGMHYPVSEAGVWVDCIHARQAVIHNDYASLPHRKGLPKGHAELLREVVVPVFRENKIVAVMGVGNKTQDYLEQDQALVGRVADMAYDFVERKQAEQRIEYMAYYDVLTDLPNRELLADRLKQAIAQSRRSKHSLAVCYLDLDGFKPINDQYGHHIGDVLLVKLAQRLKSKLREGDTLARLGGDEFVLLLNELGSLYDGEQIIHRLLQSIQEPFEIDAHRILISGSIGATVYPLDGGDADTLMRHADQAMYKAKTVGKSSYRLYDPLQDQKVRAHRQALEEFDQALKNRQIVLHYQPKIDLRSGEVKGFEALARWQHPSKGILPPAAFLPLIEGSPEEFLLGESVLRSALDQHMAWREQGVILPVSVNVSPRHIQLKGFADFLARLLADYPAGTAQRLELEVLETSAIGDTSQVADVMGACADLGVRFSLDDFGTGYSSLTYFHRLPINVLKIDQNFVRNMLDDVRDLDIVEGVLRLSEALNRPVVAEGVETIEIGMMLLQLGCRYAQGYGIARPMPAEQVIAWLGEWQNTSPWHRLSREIEGRPELFDLNVSIFSHRHWLQNVVKGIEAGDLAALPKLGEQDCQFSRWLKGVGQARYGSHPSFAFIIPKHRQVHEMAADAAAAMQAGEKAVVQARLAELTVLCDELIELLKGLAQKH